MMLNIPYPTIDISSISIILSSLGLHKNKSISYFSLNIRTALHPATDERKMNACKCRRTFTKHPRRIEVKFLLRNNACG